MECWGSRVVGVYCWGSGVKEEWGAWVGWGGLEGQGMGC